jgi:phosphodiesterase/alkaline phosphatase D-like protein
MSGATIVARLTKDASVRLAVSTSSDLSSPTYTTEQDTVDRVAKITVTGLSADTQYYCGVEIDGVLNTALKGKFKTLPSGSAFNFKCAFAGDADTGSDHAVFDQIRTQAPLFFIHLGDAHYRNFTTNESSRYRSAYNVILQTPKPGQLLREVPTVYVWDDHDYSDNDSYSAAASRAAACAAYRQRVPSYPLEEAAADGAIYHAFEVGRVVFIVTDQRSRASNPAAADNSSKSMLGTTQKAWFKSILSDVANAEKLFVWICPRVFGGTTSAGADHWGGFTTERTELADYIQANCPGRVCVISADRHSLAIDDGTNHDFVTSGNEPIPTFQAAPLDQSINTHGGGTYSEGNFTNNGQFGVMEITDAGGGTITVDWTGYDSAASVLVTHQFVVSL